MACFIRYHNLVKAALALPNASPLWGEMSTIMATKTATKKSNKPVVREAEAKAVVDSTTVADSAGSMLAASFASENSSADERRFEQARIAFHAVTTGAKPNDIAKATAKAASLNFPEERRSWAEATSVTNGGAKVTRVTIVQRSDAYASILASGIDSPTMELVTTAFRAFTSKGSKGLAEAHKKLQVETLALPEGEREAHYLGHAFAVSAGVVASNKAAGAEAHSEKSATDAADSKSDVHDDVPLESAADFIAYVRASVSRPWSDTDRADIMAALAEIVSA